MDYKSLVKRGEVNPSLKFSTYSKYSKDMEKHLIGVKTPLGFEIRGFTPHCRVIGHAGLSEKHNRRGVSLDDLIRCLKSGKIGKSQISPKGEKSIKLYTDNCGVSVNPDKKILIQCNPKKPPKKIGEDFYEKYLEIQTRRF